MPAGRPEPKAFYLPLAFISPNELKQIPVGRLIHIADKTWRVTQVFPNRCAFMVVPV